MVSLDKKEFSLNCILMRWESAQPARFFMGRYELVGREIREAEMRAFLFFFLFSCSFQGYGKSYLTSVL